MLWHFLTCDDAFQLWLKSDKTESFLREYFHFCITRARLAKYFLGRKIPGSNVEEFNLFYLLHTFPLLLVLEVIECEGQHQIF